MQPILRVRETTRGRIKKKEIETKTKMVKEKMRERRRDG